MTFTSSTRSTVVLINEHRYADAFIQLCQLATPALPEVRGERPHMFVTTTLEALQRQIGSTPGSLEGGHLIGKGALRRIACDANIIPAVLGSAGQPLDIGRSTRLVSQGLRRALILRDGGCAFPGCDRPPLWCDAIAVQPRAALRAPSRPST